MTANFDLVKGKNNSIVIKPAKILPSLLGGRPIEQNSVIVFFERQKIYGVTQSQDEHSEPQSTLGQSKGTNHL